MGTAKQSKDKRRVKGEASKQAIIEAAIACIADNGLSGLTLEQVARRAKVSRGLVVFHFKSKHGLMTDLLEDLGSRYSDGWERALASDGTSAGQRLLRLLDYEVSFAAAYPKYLSVWHAFWGDAKSNSLYREIYLPPEQRYSKLMRDLLEDLVQEGGYNDLDPKAVDAALDAMLWGISVSAHLYPTSNFYGESMEALRVVLRKLFPRHEWDSVAPVCHAGSSAGALAQGASG